MDDRPLPLTTRDQLVHAQLAHPPDGAGAAGTARPVRAGVTGSGATLLVLTWTAEDLGRERAAGARLLGCLGIIAGMRVANTLPGGLATPGALLLGDVVEEIGGLDIPLGTITSDAAARAAWELFDRVQPQVLVLDAASAGPLASAVPAAARPWWQGIVWLQTDAAPRQRPALPPAAGFTGWQRVWLGIAEATSFVAHSCAAGRFHGDDGVRIEIVDPTGSASISATEVGQVALTLSSVNTPALRYLSDLRARLVARCTCGGDGVVFELAG